MEPGEYGLTCGTCFVARRLEVVAVAELMWISWCTLGAAGLRVFHDFAFSNSCARPLAARDPAQSVTTREGATTASQSAHRELAPTDPHQVYHLLCSHLRIMASVDQ